MHLVDSNVLSNRGTRPSRRRCSTGRLDGCAFRDEPLLSTITVVEIDDGIARLRRSGSLARAECLRPWACPKSWFLVESAQFTQRPFGMILGLSGGRQRNRRPQAPARIVAQGYDAEPLVGIAGNAGHVIRTVTPHLATACRRRRLRVPYPCRRSPRRQPDGLSLDTTGPEACSR